MIVYYEKAMMMRSRENTIYFASVNYALRFQESATSLIAPSGECQAYSRRNVRSRREWRAQRPDDRPRSERVESSRAPTDVHARADRTA